MNTNLDAGLAETRMVYPIFPADANHYGTLFGGQAMSWMDQAAFICATRWCRRKVVTPTAAPSTSMWPSRSAPSLSWWRGWSKSALAP